MTLDSSRKKSVINQSVAMHNGGVGVGVYGEINIRDTQKIIHAEKTNEVI